MKFFKFAVLALIFPLAMLFADTDYRAEAATIKEKFAQAIKLMSMVIILRLER